jgi:hypothetical protein
MIVIGTMMVIWTLAYHRLVPLKVLVHRDVICPVPSKVIMSPLELCGMSRMNQHLFDPPEDEEEDGLGRDRNRSKSAPAVGFAHRNRIFSIG